MPTTVLRVSGRPAELDGSVSIADVLDPVEQPADAECAGCMEKGTLVRRTVRHVPASTKCVHGRLR